MSKNDFTVMDVIQALIADDSWEKDPQKRAQIAYGLYGTLFLLSL